MSRVGRLPIAIPAGVTVTVADNNTVTVKGPKGELVQAMNADMTIKVENNEVVVTRPSDVKEHRALHGLTRALINNMITGVEKGYSKTLILNGVGYRAQKQGNKLVMNLGYSHPVEIKAIEGVEFEIPEATKVIVQGIDKQKVGEAAAQIRSWRKPEPYKGKGIRYENEVIRRKEGKTGK
ncbi:50S ribosomal protein L6 [Clostridium chrysemydis]|uniref:50S ribosomal protein L6 n=1 Tax=Clostridium chrysemydis TaxID=2665504 RepID=UPI0018846116|nr:50S ribosomal protein L6 [Clostridium chrysemydis]